MHRYFVDPNNMNKEVVKIVGDDVHHIAKVMRFQPGDQVICSDGKGNDVLARIDSIQAREVLCSIESTLTETAEPNVQLILAQGLPKADKMELIIQKGTETGISSFIPFTSQRTIVKLDQKKEQKKLERWDKIAKEAAEQAHRSKIPTIHPVFSWKELLDWMEGKLVLIAYEKENTMKLSKALADAIKNTPQLKEAVLVIGPEGGFSEEEILQAEQRGAISVSLGKRILRTETAGLVGAANIVYHLEELEG